MTDATATLNDLSDSRLFNVRIVFPVDEIWQAVRRLAVGAAVSVGGLAASGALVVAVTGAAAWLIATIVDGSPGVHSKAARDAATIMRPTQFSLLSPVPLAPRPADFADALGFEARWARVMTLPGMSDGLGAQALKQTLARLNSQAVASAQLPPGIFAPNLTIVPPLTAMAELPTTFSAAPASPAPLAEHNSTTATETPLPRPYPGKREMANLAPAEQSAPAVAPSAPAVGQTAPLARQTAPAAGQSGAPTEPQVASLEPPPSPFSGFKFPFPLPWEHSAPLPGQDSHTAIYDIAAHTVYLPNGERLEAHSGLGDKMDNPRYVRVKNRGPTPPNVYDLALREQLFHGVQAIRLKPVDESKMFGRDGMLAHTYMLGPNGQSNGCVSFRNYAKFLQAVKRGEVTRLVVVPRLGNGSSGTAGAQNDSGWRGHRES